MRRLFAALLVVGSFGCSKEPEPPQHVLLIVVDTLRADHLSCMGYPRPTSPHIDALAAEGVLFERAISQASYTSPSMVSLMTGRYIAKERLDIPADLPTLAESFAKAGWATAGFSSNPLVSVENGFGRGFAPFQKIEEYGSDDAIAQWFASVKGKPSLTYIHITEPHDPYVVRGGKQEWREKRDLLPGDRAEYLPRIAAELGLEAPERDLERIREEIGGYDDDVRYADARVGRFLELFAASGLAERGVVALTADHGEGLWEKVALMNGQRGQALRRGEKPSLFNTLMPTHGNQVHRELVNVPLVLRGAKLPKARRVATPVENVDLFPTLLELCDLPTPGGLQGESLVGLASGSKRTKDHAFSFTRFNTTVFSPEGWALILPTAEGECGEGIRLELFDLNKDPYQRHDVSKEHPDVVERLRKVALQRLERGIRAQGVVNDASMTAMAQLGYGNLIELENLRRDFDAMPNADLIAKRLNMATPCIERLIAAEVLSQRKLEAPEREALAKLLPFETSRAVLEIYERLLAR
ncbi:MAG: sulfatase [Planctomycetota bacterium]|nr:sulfatase [Planctomycetota bacterium]